MKTIALAILLAITGTAGAQDPSKSEPQKPALNLRLDDGTTAAPRISFDQRPSAQTKEEREKGLPDLGGKPSKAFERPLNSNTSAGTIPKAFDPSLPGGQ
jgi:hypothetical protein